MNKIFKQSMEVGALFIKEYYNEDTHEWKCSEECSMVTAMTIEYAETYEVPLEKALDLIMEHVLTNGFDVIKDHMWDDYCRGFLAGEILGMPTDENLKKVTKAEKLWEYPSYYGYYHEVLGEVK